MATLQAHIFVIGSQLSIWHLLEPHSKYNITMAYMYMLVSSERVNN